MKKFLGVFILCGMIASIAQPLGSEDGRNEPYATPMAADPPVQAFSRSSTPEVATPVAIEDASDDPPTQPRGLHDVQSLAHVHTCCGRGSSRVNIWLAILLSPVVAFIFVGTLLATGVI